MYMHDAYIYDLNLYRTFTHWTRTLNKDDSLQYKLSIILDWRYIRLQIAGSSKWRFALGCTSESKFCSSSDEHTHYCTLFCLPGNIINLFQFTIEAEVTFCISFLQNVVPVLCTNLEGNLSKVRWRILSLPFCLTLC